MRYERSTDPDIAGEWVIPENDADQDVLRTILDEKRVFRTSFPGTKSQKASFSPVAWKEDGSFAATIAEEPSYWSFLRSTQEVTTSPATLRLIRGGRGQIDVVWEAVGQRNIWPYPPVL